MKFKNYVVDTVTTYYKTTLAIVMVITAIMAYFYSIQTHNNNFEAFLKKDNPLLLQFQTFIEKYGSETTVLIAFKDQNLLTNKNIQLIRDLSTSLKNIQGVENVTSLTEMEEITSVNDTIGSQKIIPDGKLSKSLLELIKEKIHTNTLYGSLISKDGTVNGIFVEMVPFGEKKMFTIMEEIIKVSRKIAQNRVTLHFSGGLYIDAEMNRLSQRDIMTFTFATAFLVFIIIILLFKGVALTILANFAIIITQIWGFGFFVLCGEEFNMVTSIMSAIFLAMAVADTVHLLSHFLENYQYNETSYAKNVADATKAIWTPCLLTTLTTCAGFLSFTVSTFRPTYILGIFTAAGIFFAFILDVTFLPAALMLMRKRIEKFLSKKNETKRETEFHGDGFFLKILSAIGNFSTRYSLSLTLLFFILIGVGVIGVLKLKYHGNNLDWLPDNNEVKKDYFFVEDNFGGFFQDSLLITSKGHLDFTHPEAVELVDKIQMDISDFNKGFYSSSFSIANYLKEYNKVFNNHDPQFYTIPETRTEILDFYYELGDPEILDHLIDDDYREICIAFMAKWSSPEEAVTARAHTKDYLKKNLGDAFDFSLPGGTTLWLAMEDLLRSSQVRSFSVAFILIFFMMLYVCKSIKMTIISTLPNIFPILMTLGFMGWFDIALDSATIMIASVTLGIAVDDTIHFIAWYRRSCHVENNRKKAIIKTFRSVGKPITITTIILFFGFGVLIFGSFQPVRTYGVLTACSMLFALIGDFFMLPALIMVFKPKVKPLTDMDSTVIKNSVEPAGDKKIMHLTA